MAKCKNNDPQQEFANSIWLLSYCHTEIISSSEFCIVWVWAQLYNVQGVVYTSFPFMGITNYTWPFDQPSRTAVPSVSKTNVHHWMSLSWQMLLVAQVSLTALLNQLLSWDMWLCPISIFLTRDYDGDKRALCCLYLPRCLLSFRKEKK